MEFLKAQLKAHERLQVTNYLFKRNVLGDPKEYKDVDLKDSDE